MRCPYCDVEMVQGAVQSLEALFWTQHPKRLFYLPGQGDYILGKGGGELRHMYETRPSGADRFTWGRAVAHRCRRCGVILVPKTETKRVLWLTEQRRKK